MDSKSEINNEAEKTCATGKFAALYGVSVRTVQYYDEKDLLPPSGLTEGGRRIYTEPMLLGGNKLPGKLHIVGCVLLNARAIGISVVRRHGGHPKMNCHVAALWEASTFPTLPNRLITPVDRAVGIVRVYNLSVLVEQHGIHLRMGVSRSIYLNDINEGSCGICCGRKCINPQRQNRQKKTPTSPLATWAFQLHHKWKNPLEPVPQMHL